jgi:hypothetical protein
MRCASSHAPVKQIITGTVCHLEAAMVERSLEGWDLSQLDFSSSRMSGTWFVLLPTTWGKHARGVNVGD